MYAEIILWVIIKRKKNIIRRYIQIYILPKYALHQRIAASRPFTMCANKTDIAENILNIHISNSTKEVIHVKLVRHLQNDDWGTGEVHANSIIRLTFPSIVLITLPRNTLNEITRAANDCLRFDLSVTPPEFVDDGVQGKSAFSVTWHRIIHQGTTAESFSKPH